MPNKRLLLLIEDPFLCRFYSAKLQGAGFAVDAARALPEGLELLGAQKPDLLIVDPLLRAADGEDAIGTIRAQAPENQPPILSLPTPLYPLSERVAGYPNVKQLTTETNPLGELLKVAATTLSLPAHDGATLMLHTMPDDDWKQQAIAAALETLAEFRQGLHQLSRDTNITAELHSVLLSIHRFAGQTGLLNRTALSHIARAVEVLVFALERTADHVEPLTLRTLGQAADFLALLLDEKTHSQVPSLEAARIMVIEDEAAARDLIITAMEMVGLQAAGSATPKTGLSALGAQSCDLIFLDINLPEMNGFELCNKVRALPLHERTPIVFLTGMNSFQNRVQSSLSGGNDFVGKPFNLAELGVKALIWVMKGRLGLN